MFVSVNEKAKKKHEWKLRLVAGCSSNSKGDTVKKRVKYVIKMYIRAKMN